MNLIEEERQVLNESTSKAESEQEMNPSAGQQKITTLYEALC